MASFGSFAMDTLVASTRALASNSGGDEDYARIESQITSLTNQRDALAAQIRQGLNQAQFEGRSLSESQIRSWTRAADDLLAQAHALAEGP
jgi:hypothetical protein